MALSLPEVDESGIRDKVFDESVLDDLKADDGFETLLTFLDKKLKKDDLTDSLEKFKSFEDDERDSSQSILDYISKFDQNYHKIKKLNMTFQLRFWHLSC